MGACVDGANVVGATVVGEIVVGEAVVGAIVVGESVVGAIVVGSRVVLGDGASAVSRASVGKNSMVIASYSSYCNNGLVRPRRCCRVDRYNCLSRGFSEEVSLSSTIAELMDVIRVLFTLMKYDSLLTDVGWSRVYVRVRGPVMYALALPVPVHAHTTPYPVRNATIIKNVRILCDRFQ